MFSIGVRDHVMIAHSFRGELFGPAQQLHGATYIIDVELRRPTLDPVGVVVDIGRASAALGAVLNPLRYKNLDQEADFQNVNTTTEFLARVVFDRMRERIRRGELGLGSDGLTSMKVTVRESHVAWAAYEADLGAM